MKTWVKEKFLKIKIFGKQSALLSKKFNARERISLSKNSEIVKTENGTAEIFAFFW